MASTMSTRTELLATGSEVADEVRHFYDRYPYPPPVDNLEKYQERWHDPQRKRADFHLFWPDRVFREDQSILVAGCGTSQAAKHALRWPAAQVIGIDCSATSVRYTEELKKKHNLKNLEVQPCAIERASDLGLSFDQIVCTGVLHHLADPDAALIALRRVLKLDGAMHLMVYAPYGRAGVYMIQEFCRRIGIHPSDGEIRDLMRALGALPAGHPLQSLLTQAPELQDELTLADALLHPKDRAYSVPQLLELIEGAALRFGRWIRQAPYSAQCGVMSRIPQAARIMRLPLEEQYAVAELFRGTMIRHSAVVYRNDCAGPSQPINLAGDGWLDYVPIRMPDTICIEDGLEPGTAAVLINRTHTYRDLFLAVGQIEKRFFDTIDGQHKIGDIVERALSSSCRSAHLDLARSFFERLWWHDLVVFETAARATA